MFSGNDSAVLYIDSIPYISFQERQQLLDVFKSFSKVRRHSLGRMLVFAIPFDKVDFYLCNSGQGLTPARVSTFSDLSLSQMSFLEFNQLQGRIIDFHCQDPTTSVTVFEDTNLLKEYQARICDILTR